MPFVCREAPDTDGLAHIQLRDYVYLSLNAHLAPRLLSLARQGRRHQEGDDARRRRL